jgi:RHS repeat-associated protein
LPDVKIDSTAASSLVSGCREAARVIREQVSHRRSLTKTASVDFTGRFSRLFTDNQDTANEDGEQIAVALTDVAKQVQHIIDIVPDENRRRQEARAWKKRHDEDKAHITLSDLGGDEDPPEGPKSPPAPKVVSASAKDRDTPSPGTGATGSGTSSARPDKLRSFATGSAAKIEELSGKASSLKSLNSDFTAGFDWGTGEPAGVDGSSVYSALSLYQKLNRADQKWVNTVAAAFEQAGGSGGVVTLSNAALAAQLKANGVAATRQDIPPTSPAVMGVSPTTGYSDDPVNTATGNFVEPETDLEFAGGCASLRLDRMYNSFRTAVGGFGVGWSSVTEVGLDFDAEGARFTRPDGRAVDFPRHGDGWGRAVAESLWLQRDVDGFRLTDGDGGSWRFDGSGRPVSQDRGAGTMVRFVRERIDGEDRLVRLEHERGRHIDLIWASGHVVAATSSDGRRIDYSYDADGRLTAASGPLGTRTYRWNADGLIEQVIDADGVVEVANSYDSEGRVATQLSPHGRTSRYSYLSGRVTEVADPDGSRANTWIADGRGRLVGIIDADGNRQSTNYDANGNPILVIGPDGAATVREYDDRGHLTRQVSPTGADLQFGYDDQDRVSTVVTEAGAVTNYDYDDDNRNPSLIVDPEGGRTELVWTDGLLTRITDPTGVVVGFGYDTHGDLITTTDAEGNTARLERDAAGRVTAAITPSGHRTSYRYDAVSGLLSTRTDPDGAVWCYSHTAAGRLATVTDPAGAVTTMEYGDGGDETATVDPLGRRVTRTLDDLGNLAAVELPDGATWRFTHDALSRLVETITPDGRSWRRLYDSDGELTATEDPTGARIAVTDGPGVGEVTASDPTCSVLRGFDPLGRPTTVGQPDGSVAVATYDRCGRGVEQLDADGGLTRIDRDAAGRPVAVTDPTGATTRYDYDRCGRLSDVTDPNGATTRIRYNRDGLAVRTEYAAGEVGWTSYDNCGRVQATHRPGAGTWRYRYDAVGRVSAISDPEHGRRTFGYDAAGQLIKAVNGNGGITRYGYDANGRAVEVTDPLGHVTRREFDAMNRCVAETDPLGRTTRAGYDPAGRLSWQEDASGRRTAWTYDAAGRVTSMSVDGRVVTTIERDLADRTVTISDHTDPHRPRRHRLAWNRRGQMVSRSRDDDGIEREIGWEYDAAGRRVAMTTPDGHCTRYSRDRAGRLTAVDHPLLGRVIFDHDASGRLTTATARDLIQSDLIQSDLIQPDLIQPDLIQPDLIQRWEYHDGFVTGHTLTTADGATRTRILRDDQGRIAGIDRDGATTSYEYDRACQLVAARLGDERHSWRYDLAGRLLTEQRAGRTLDYAYDAGGQLLSITGVDGSTRHDYDRVGRRTHSAYPDGRTRDYTWSVTGSLAEITDRGSAERHTGDGGAVRRTRLQVDGLGELAAVDDVAMFTDTADPYPARLIQAGGTAVLPTGPVTGIGTGWTTPGWRTSRSDNSDPWAALEAAYGQNGGHERGTDGTRLPAGFGIGGAGELCIAGLEWLDARAYDPTSRGFLSVDPLDPVAGAGWAGNPYSYAGNDPLHALDPTGLKPVSEAELANARKPWYEKAWDATTSWVGDNWEYLAGGAMAIAGGALIATGIGGPAGMALVSAGADTIIQKATTGKVNWGEVAVSGAMGGAGAAVGTGFKAIQTAKYAKYGVESFKELPKATKITMMTGKAAAEGTVGFTGGGATELTRGAKFGSRQMWAGAVGGGVTAGIGSAGSELGSISGSTVRGRLLKDVESKPFIARKLRQHVEAPVADFTTNVGTRMATDFTGGAVGESVDQMIRPGDQDGNRIWNKGAQRVVTGRLNAGLRHTVGEGRSQGAGRPIGLLVDGVM